MRLLVRPDAAADIDEAFQWYQQQRQGLGEEFLAALRSTLTVILAHADLYPVIRRDTRRALLRRFPYGVFYRVYPDVIVVVACMHARRDPKRWRSRV